MQNLGGQTECIMGNWKIENFIGERKFYSRTRVKITRHWKSTLGTFHWFHLLLSDQINLKLISMLVVWTTLLRECDVLLVEVKRQWSS